jgi:hypothetical protein
MSAFHTGYCTNGLTGLGVYYFDPSIMRYIKSVCRSIRKQIVPTSFAADLPLLDDVILTLTLERKWVNEYKATERSDGKQDFKRLRMVWHKSLQDKARRTVTLPATPVSHCNLKSA